MFISSRVQDIVQLLIQSYVHITIKDIAEKLGLAERTVYNEIPEVNRILQIYNITLETVTGKGMKLCGREEDLLRLYRLIEENKFDYGWSSQARIDMLTLILLSQNDYIKTSGIATSFKVSVQTVRNDLEQVEAIARNHNLNLESKKGVGIFLQGNDVQKGHLAANIIMRCLDVDVFFGCLRNDKKYKQIIITILENYGYKRNLEKTYNILGDVIRDSFLNITDRKFQEIVLLISMLIKYHGKSSGYDSFNTAVEDNETDQHLSNEIKNVIERELKIRLSKGEVQYLYWIVSINNEEKFRNKFLYNSYLNTMKKTQDLISSVESKLGINLKIDSEFIRLLDNHISSALERTRNGVHISNPLKKEMQIQYEDVVNTIKECVESVFYGDVITEDEIAYLALYFAVAIDKTMTRSLRVLVVCTSGMGSSKMLAGRLEREIPEVCIEKIVALIQFNQENLEEYDLIISTIPLHIDKEQYIIVSPLLNSKEIDMIKNIVKGKRKSKISRTYNPSNIELEKHDGNLLSDLKNINQVSEWGISIIENFRMIEFEEAFCSIEHIKKILWGGGLYNNTDDLIGESDNIAYDVFFEIPSSQLGYLEVKLISVSQPKIFLLINNNEAADNICDNKPLKNIKSIIMIVYSDAPGEVLLNFLGNIVLMIIENVDIIRCFEKGNEDGIKRALGSAIKGYLQDRF